MEVLLARRQQHLGAGDRGQVRPLDVRAVLEFPLGGARQPAGGAQGRAEQPSRGVLVVARHPPLRPAVLTEEHGVRPVDDVQDGGALAHVGGLRRDVHGGEGADRVAAQDDVALRRELLQEELDRLGRPQSALRAPVPAAVVAQDPEAPAEQPGHPVPGLQRRAQAAFEDRDGGGGAEFLAIERVLDREAVRALDQGGPLESAAPGVLLLQADVREVGADRGGGAEGGDHLAFEPHPRPPFLGRRSTA